MYEKGQQLCRKCVVPGGSSGAPWLRKDISEKLPVQRNIRRKCWDDQLRDEIIDSIPWRSTNTSDLLFAHTEQIPPAQVRDSGDGKAHPGP